MASIFNPKKVVNEGWQLKARFCFPVKVGTNWRKFKGFESLILTNTRFYPQVFSSFVVGRGGRDILRVSRFFQQQFSLLYILSYQGKKYTCVSSCTIYVSKKYESCNKSTTCREICCCCCSKEFSCLFMFGSVGLVSRNSSD